MAVNVSRLLLRRVGALRNLDKLSTISIYHTNNNNVPLITGYNGFALNGVHHQVARYMSKDVRRSSSSTARDLASDSDSSSDSDKGKTKGKGKQKRGNSEFWRLKMRTLHAVFDINKDGVVSWDDFCVMADRFVKLGHLTPAEQEEFKDTLKSVFEEQWGPTDPYNMVNAYQYLDNMTHVINDKSLKKKAHRFLPYLFNAVDHDHSGEISVEEFKLFFKCLGLKEEDAVASFRAIDINHDNCLSQKEFVKYGKEYFLSENEKKPSRYLWGPLLEH